MSKADLGLISKKFFLGKFFSSPLSRGPMQSCAFCVTEVKCVVGFACVSRIVKTCHSKLLISQRCRSKVLENAKIRFDKFLHELNIK